MKKSEKESKKNSKLRDLKPKKDAKGGGDITITKTVGSSSGTILK
jgi:hypothetical protein